MAFQFSEHFCSNARITYLRQFRFGRIEFGDSSNSWKKHNFIREHGYYPKVPVLIQSNALPWDIANSYLISLLEQKQIWEIESVNTRAKGLLAYLRFLEDANLDFLYLPKNNRQKAPYRFRSKLNELIYEGLSVSYASNCIRAVIDFYKHIVQFKLINEELLTNTPYQSIEAFVNYMSSEGFNRIRKVTTTDISIKVPVSQTPVDHIKDGGSLRPLSINEQKLLKSYIDAPDSNSALSLMVKIAITTGARLQTICTLRSYHIDYLYNELQKKLRLNKSGIRIELSTGKFRDIDTKNGTIHRLVFSQHIIESLYIYSVSRERERREATSYYGKTRNNYLFLTRAGNPFYTSKIEVFERQNQETSLTLSSPPQVIRAGGSVEKLFKSLVHSIRVDHPEVKEFRFHDLRATFGMNLVRGLSSSGITGVQLLTSVRDRMGHKDISVTQRYLNFDEMLKEMEDITESYEKKLFGTF